MTHDCKLELRNAFLKVTPARLAILSLLEHTKKPIDVSSIIEYLKQTSIKADPATVFRIIRLFTDKGLTKQIQLNEGKFRYEYSLKSDHHHLICRECGSIEDISDCGIDILKKEIEEKKKFLVKNHSLEFFGVCQQCQR